MQMKAKEKRQLEYCARHLHLKKKETSSRNILRISVCNANIVVHLMQFTLKILFVHNQRDIFYQITSMEEILKSISLCCLRN
ncbi:hypothetical protein T4D_2200 [Trichinella pseudospiralis]|uniref:Uncharacterized protein n=1 Tax=Trichinella pseudospiralis TaxID=6337 RepID=A0A0V1FWW7_TRIPS|nr:hypothetical protein T4D_2200 [Trichinella pseudospiralis]